MARKPKRDLTVEEQLARGPLDLPFLMLTMLLLGVGLIMMFSASFATAYYNDGDPLVYIKNQAVYAAAGVVVMFLVSKINYQTFRLLSVPGIVAAILLLVLALSPLGVELNEVKRWVRIGPIQFQPSEVAKVAVILFFATRLSKRDTEKKKKWSRRTLTGRTLERLDRIGFLELVPYGAILMVIALLMLMEPHMSGTILVLAGGASVLFAAGISLGWFAAGGTLVAGAMWFIITQTPYMTARINLWLDPWAQRQGDGFQTVQSLLAIGSGGLLGLGLGKSRQKFLYVPEPENDFVFPIVAEELGIHRGGGGAAPVLPADHAGVLAGTPRTGQIRSTDHRGHYHPAGGPSFPERGRGHQSDPQYRNLPPLLQLRRNSADDPAGGDGDRIEHIQTDPGTQK